MQVEDLQTTTNKSSSFQKFFSLNSREIAILGALASFSLISGVVKIPPFRFFTDPVSYIAVDIVGVFWAIAFFLFALKGYLIVSGVGLVLVSLFSSGGWVGGIMKFAAVGFTVLGFYLVLLATKTKVESLGDIKKKWPVILVGLLNAFIFRGIGMYFLYYYFAFPAYVGVSPERALQMVPIYNVVGLNILSAVIDLTLAFVLVYVFKLDKFGRRG